MAVLDRRAHAKGIREAVQGIDEDAWVTIEDYPEEGKAQIAETVCGDRRLIIRRSRLLGAQAQLWPDWRHFAFLTNRTDELAWSRQSIVTMPSSSRCSLISGTRRWRTSLPGSSSPTAAGRCSARSRTTCSDGHN
jgi:hypothetical protein